MAKTGERAASPDEGIDVGKADSPKKAKEVKKKAGRRAVEAGEGGQFEVLAGIHVEGTGEEKVVYEAGEIVDSDKPLDTMFRNKFRRLDGSTKRPRDLDERLDESGRVMDRPLHKKRRPVEGPERTVRHRNKASKLDFATDEEEERENQELLDTDESDTADHEGEDEENPLGEDTTAEFEDAVKSDLKVFKRSGKNGKYTVVDADEPTRPLPKGSDLKDAKAVNKFLSSYRSKG